MFVSVRMILRTLSVSFFQSLLRVSSGHRGISDGDTYRDFSDEPRATIRNSPLFGRAFCQSIFPISAQSLERSLGRAGHGPWPRAVVAMQLAPTAPSNAWCLARFAGFSGVSAAALVGVKLGPEGSIRVKARRLQGASTKWWPWSEREVRILRRDYGKPGRSLRTIAAKLGRTCQ